MTLKEIGTLLLFLVGLLIFGNLWFHLVESILAGIKRLFMRGKTPPPWHPLPPEQKACEPDGNKKADEERQNSLADRGNDL